MSGPAELYGRRHRDPLWDVEVERSGAELALVRSPALTRLHRVRQAGAGWLTTGETSSRLEHTLGVHALAVHLCPDDAELRAAALLHDVGHLPLSHTLEGLAGLDHHVLGADRIAALREPLTAAGLDPGRVTALALGTEPSVLRPGGGRLGLDHLDGLVRCADAHGWTHDVPPGALEVRDGAVIAAPPAADALARLTLANARWHRHAANVGPVAVVRHLVGRLLADGAATTTVVTALGDDELWALLLGHDATRADTQRLLRAPFAPVVRTGDGQADPGELVLDAPAAYAPRPAAVLSDAAQRDLAATEALPRRFLVAW